jgi:hypothetical protein
VAVWRYRDTDDDRRSGFTSHSNFKFQIGSFESRLCFLETKSIIYVAQNLHCSYYYFSPASIFSIPRTNQHTDLHFRYLYKINGRVYGHK